MRVIGLVRSLHDRTAAICNGGSKSYYNFLVTLLAMESTVTCVIIWLYIRGSDINLRNVLSSVQVDSTGGLMLITMKICL